MLPSDSTDGVDWFDAGWAVFADGLRDPAYFPPLNDMEAQRQWLGSFGAAWAEAPAVQAASQRQRPTTEELALAEAA